MQKNWYAVYTKPHWEKKVSHALRKKGVEVFLPFNYKKNSSLLRAKEEPLFESFLFLKETEANVINVCKHVNGVLSLLYWLQKLATINEEDINAIKEFTNNHKEIELERHDVNAQRNESISDDVLLTIDGNILTVQNRAIRVNLPSLGFTMVARKEDENIFGRKIYLDRKDMRIHQ